MIICANPDCNSVQVGLSYVSYTKKQELDWYMCKTCQCRFALPKNSRNLSDLVELRIRDKNGAIIVPGETVTKRREIVKPSNFPVPVTKTENKIQTERAIEFE